MIETNYYNISSRPYLKQSNNALNKPSFKASSDRVELSSKSSNKEEKKSFLSRFGIDIAAFMTGIAGIGVAIKTHKANKLLKNNLIRDELTGLSNRRHFNEYLENSFNTARKNSTDLHVFVLDFDRFKAVNSALGHDGGDSVLVHSSKAIMKVVDKYKEKGVNLLFARTGGEEFALVINEVPKKKALEIAQEIRAAVNGNKELKPYAERFAEFYKNEADKLRVRGEHNLGSEELHLLNDYDFLHNHVSTNNGFTISAGMSSLQDHRQIVKIPHDIVKLADLASESAKSTRDNLCTVGNTEVAEYAKFKLDNAARGKAKLSDKEKAHFNELIGKNQETV